MNQKQKNKKYLFRSETKQQQYLNFITDLKTKDDRSNDYEIGFSTNIFMLFGLPNRKLPGNPRDWEKKTKIYKLTLSRPANSKYSIPFGSFARMNQIFIDTQLIKYKDPVINIGKCFTDYVRLLGYHKGGSNELLLKQLINYISCSIFFEPLDMPVNQYFGLQAFIGKSWNLGIDPKNPDQQSFDCSKIVISDDYTAYAITHAIPLNLNFIRLIRGNTLALDFYRYLAYRAHNLKKSVSFRDIALIDHLATNDKNIRKIRHNLKEILYQIKVFWPVQAYFEDGYFQLSPSPPATFEKKEMISVPKL